LLTPLEDANFVEWYATFDVLDKEERTYQIVKTHKCTEEDYSKFHPILEHQQASFEVKKKKNIFHCLDKTDQFGRPVNNTLFGDWDSGYCRELSLIFRPCIPRQKTEFNQGEACLIEDIHNKT